MPVRRPDRRIGDKGGSEQMRIDPPNASTVHPVRPHEGSDVGMTDSRNPVNEVVRVQQLRSPAGISDQQLAIHEVVPGGFVSLEQAVEFGSEGHSVGEKTDPDRSVY
jgi:hypothetical protein